MEEVKLKKKMLGYGRFIFLIENVLFENCLWDLLRIIFVVSWNRLLKFFFKDIKDKIG